MDAQLLPCGMGKVMVVKLPTPVTDEVRVTCVFPVELIIGELPFHIWTTTELYDW